eukprot:3944815-Pleurochrysis_carterae.AAC.1
MGVDKKPRQCTTIGDLHLLATDEHGIARPMILRDVRSLHAGRRRVPIPRPQPVDHAGGQLWPPAVFSPTPQWGTI